MPTIKAYKDDACTLLANAPQKFTRANSSSPFQAFVLTIMTGPELSNLYRYNGVTHVRLVQRTDYTLSGNTINLAAPLGATEVLIASPANRFNLNFGGVFGAVKTSTGFVVFKRDAGYTYDTLMLSSEDLDVERVVYTYMDSAFTFVANQNMLNAGGQVVYGSRCTSDALIGLTVNALQGLALVLNNVFIGKILANDATSILVDNLTYARAGVVTDDVSVFSLGSLLFALNVDGSVPPSGDFKPVINLPNLEVGRDTVKVWVRDTMTVPETSTNYPDMAFALTGIEYVE